MLGDATGTCRICGQDGTGMPFGEWVRDTFTDHDKLRPGEIICHACQFLFAEASELLAAKVGKDKPQRMRNYSHIVVNDTWHPLNKGRKRKMRDLLLRSPSLAVIAESGQKHLLFRAQPGWLQFEEQSIVLRADVLANHMNVVDALYQHFNKAEIASGSYLPHRIKACGVELFTDLEEQAAPLRGGLYFDVALFLAQQQQENDNGQTAGEETPTDNRGAPARPNVAGTEPGVQIELPF
jgi:hypothetical protein